MVSVHDCELHKVVDKAVEATDKKTGLTEGSHCSVCNAVIEEQQVIPKLVPEETPSGNQTIIPVPTDKEVIKASKNGVDYKVTSKNTVDITKVDKSKSRVEIPDVVTINRKQYKVTAIKAGAFKNCNKVSEIIIGKNIKSIDKNAFTGCKSLKRIYIKSTVVNKDDVKSALLAKINKKTTIVVPKSKYSEYKKLVINLGKRKKFIVLRK